ncbi:MAG: type IV secretion system DNA-binding domain-containing protein [Bradyrhizobiaceae bacterium]|nr:type IV secretion system DNA-binding domain-containing protein [Bradyrhizobiaceae bacterium]
MRAARLRIASSKLVRRETIRSALPERFPLLKTPPARPCCDPRVTVFGLSEQDAPVTMPERPRFEHTHVIGTTGGGKTNFLEHLIRQDIKKGDGVCVIDPHGSHPDSLYRSLITWLNATGYLAKRRVHLVDPNFRGGTTGFNPLALPGEETSVSVVAGVALEAIERVWGDEDTHAKPTIRRLLKATFAALAELRLTLSEAELLFDQADSRGVRALALKKLRDRYAYTVLADLDLLARTDRGGLRFRDEVVGPFNRLAEFLSAPAIRRIVGQREHSLDLRTCLDEGHIVLVNLSGGDAVHDADTELLGRLLTRFLFFHAKRRKTAKPFWFFLDECQRYFSGDIPSLLAEARKFGLGVICSHQWQSQLGDADSQTLAAVHNATNLKAAFRIKHPREAKEIAEAVMPLDLEMPIKTLIKPTVVGNARTLFQSWSEAEHRATSTSRSRSYASSESESETDSSSDGLATGEGSASMSGQSSGQTFGTGELWPGMGDGWFVTPTMTTTTVGNSAGTSTAAARSNSRVKSRSTSKARSRSVGRTSGEVESSGEMHGTSVTKGYSEGLEPVYENLPSAVHSYENSLYFAAQALRTLGAGQAFLHFVDANGMKTARVTVPRVRQVVVPDAAYDVLRGRILAASPFGLPTEQADRLMHERETALFAECAKIVASETDGEHPGEFRVPAKRGQRKKQGSTEPVE